jgi:hypothetical protein
VDEYTTFTIYRDRSLWEGQLVGRPAVEDFEKDEADYGELNFPFLTGGGFLIEGQDETSAQILNDSSLLESGNYLHMRAWEEGLKFHFPDGQAATAFGFDYRAAEDWILRIDDVDVELPEGRKGFLGVIVHEDYPLSFVLISESHAQGGLTIDNLLYLR